MGTAIGAVSAGTPVDSINIVTEPAGFPDSRENVAFNTQPAVEVLDDEAARITDDNSTVITASILTENAIGTPTLIGTVTATCSSGVATFANLGIDLAGAGYVIRFTSDNGKTDDSAAFGNGLISPTAEATAELWLELCADVGVTDESGAAAAWAGCLSNVVDTPSNIVFEQSTSTKRPAIDDTDSGINNRRSLTFDAIDDVLVGNAASLTGDGDGAFMRNKALGTGMTIIAVCERAADNSDILLHGTDTSQNRMWVQRITASNALRLGIGVDDGIFYTEFTEGNDDQWQARAVSAGQDGTVGTGVFGATNGSGTAITDDDATKDLALNAFTIGANTSGANSFGAGVAALLFFETELTQAVMATINAELAEYYGATVGT